MDLEKILTKAENFRNFLFDLQPIQCKICKRNTHSFQMSCHMPAKVEKFEMAKDVKILTQRPIEKYIDVGRFRFIEQGSIGYLCHYHQFHNSIRTYMSYQYAIQGNHCTFVLDDEQMELLKNSAKVNAVWTLKGNVFCHDRKLINNPNFLQLNKHNVDFDWKRKMEYIPKRVGTFIVWENKIPDNFAEYIFLRLKQLGDWNSQNYKNKAEFFFDELVERIQNNDKSQETLLVQNYINWIQHII